MSDTFTAAQWKAAQQALGAKQAEEFRKRHNLSVEGYDGPYAESVDPNYEGEDVEVEEPASLAVNPASAMSDLSVGGGALEGLMEKRRQSLSALYDKAASDLQARYKGPDTNDLLLSLGAAFLQPTENGKFSESLGNVPMALLQHTRAKRDFGNDMAGLMGKLEIERAQSLGDLEEKYLTGVMKTPPRDRIQMDPIRGVPINVDTGFEVPNAGHVNGLLQNPTRTAEFDMKFGPGAAQKVLAQYANSGAQ